MQTSYSTPEATWLPVATHDSIPALTQSAADCIEGLAARTRCAMECRGEVTDGHDVYVGDAGLALLWRHILNSEHPPRGPDDDSVRSYFEHTLDRIAQRLSDTPLRPWLYGGVAGMAWAIHDAGEDAPVAIQALSHDLDDVLLRALHSTVDVAPYELFRGTAGIALYLLERPFTPTVTAALDLVAESIARAATVRDDSVDWLTPTRHLTPEEQHLMAGGGYNLGTAHGVAGLIPVLARLHARGFGGERCRALLEGSIASLLRLRNPDAEYMQLPSSVGVDGRRYPSTIGWCYSDLGTALALMVAGRYAHQTSWMREADEMGRRVASLPIATGTARRDPNLCHGTLGIAHMFARLYNYTGAVEYRDAANRWLSRTLELRQPGAFIGGYGTWRESTGWTQRVGFLNGTAGVALALMAATTSTPPRWDRLLLMS